MPDNVYGFDCTSGDFSYFASDADWENQMTAAGAKVFLQAHLRQSLVNDVEPYLALIRGRKAGFWASVRAIFPYVNFLGTLLCGHDTSLNAIDFIEEYLGRRGKRSRKKGYLDYGAALFTMYRHGLIHTHAPKVFRRADGYLVQWLMINDSTQHLVVNADTQKKLAWLVVAPEGLFEDLLDAIDEYAKDFDDPAVQAERLSKFKEGFLTMGRVFTVADLKSKAQEARVGASLAKIV